MFTTLKNISNKSCYTNSLYTELFLRKLRKYDMNFLKIGIILNWHKPKWNFPGNS